ncbi:MAG: 16S rRNA (uracil(1498)-N(3))-methyltransferase, partial [candidate division Zixibacteria bacterium]|nr:16S rRNA (uracil(1498)-N(3))-methyltransferase [candidate division Zixibacteria bacterium]
MPYRSRQRLSHAPGSFWAPADHVTSDTVILFGAEARHAFRVCRLRKGELITVCDGDGNAYDCEITAATAREVEARIIRAHRRLGEPVSQVTLAVGVGKPASFDWIVEKAVELGVARIIPIRAEQSPSGMGGDQAAKRRVERWRRLALGAMKQSLRSVWPPVEEMATPQEIAARIEDFHRTWLADPEGKRLADALAEPARTLNALLIIGPEGGFSEPERRLLLDRGAAPIALGERRLRAETAAVAALTLVMQH